MKPDLDSLPKIEYCIHQFYQQVLDDELLAPIFKVTANVDIEVHIPIICCYWEKLLPGGDRYKRHTMNIHRNIAAKTRLEAQHFERWLALFIATLEDNYEGANTQRAKQIARHIKANMERALVVN